MFDRNTIKFLHMSFGLVPEILDPVDVLMFVDKQFRMIHPIVLERRHIQYVVPTPAICIDNAIRLDFFLNDGHERLALCIWNNLCVDLAATFKDSKERDFTGSSPSPFTFSDAAKITFIQFYFFGHSRCLLRRQANHFAQAVVQIGCCMVIDFRQIGCTSGYCSDHKMFN